MKAESWYSNKTIFFVPWFKKNYQIKDSCDNWYW